MLFIITPFLGWGDLRIWLILLTSLVAAQTWVLWGKAWRKEPPGFVWRTFLDERGVPDGKLIVVCHALSVMTVTMLVGWVTNNWPPYYVWISWDFIAIAGIFGSTYVSKKYYDAGGSTDPHPDFGLPTPPPPAQGCTGEPELTENLGKPNL